MAGTALPVLVVVLGPTASGKSVVAEHLGLALGGEVVGADSMQVYRGLDVGTAKPDAEARSRVAYHLVDVADPSTDFNLGDFVRAAEAAVTAIRSRGRIPILAGGTGMYLRGFLKGIDPAPTRRPALRERLERLAHRRGVAHLHHLLAGLDPDAAAGIGPGDRMRLVRSLERVLCTGRPASRSRWRRPDRYPTIKIGLGMDPATLRRRIEERVEAMFAAGLVEETARLLDAGVDPTRSALKALGYREVVAHLRGEQDVEATIESVKRNTWRFSRRQMAWFRREEEVHWIQATGMDAAAICEEAEKYVRLRLAGD